MTISRLNLEFIFIQTFLFQDVSSNVSLLAPAVRVMSDAQESLVGLREVRFGARFALEASVECAAPAHRVLADCVPQEEVAVDSEVVAAFALVVVSCVGLSVDRLLDLVHQLGI